MESVPGESGGAGKAGKTGLEDRAPGVPKPGGRRDVGESEASKGKFEKQSGQRKKTGQGR